MLPEKSHGAGILHIHGQVEGRVPILHVAHQLRKGINLNWVQPGKGPKNPQPIGCGIIEGEPPAYVKEVRPPEECLIEELVLEIARRVAKRFR